MDFFVSAGVLDDDILLDYGWLFQRWQLAIGGCWVKHCENGDSRQLCQYSPEYTCMPLVEFDGVSIVGEQVRKIKKESGSCKRVA